MATRRADDDADRSPSSGARSSVSALRAWTLVLAFGLAILAAAPPAWGIPVHILGIMLSGIGFGLCQTPSNRTLFLSAPVDRDAFAGGVQGTARLAGQVSGALTASVLLSAYSTKMAPPIAFGIAALAALASAAIIWSNNPREGSYSPDGT